MGLSNNTYYNFVGLGDHLGNVLATVLDRKTGAGELAGSSGTLYDHWSADLASTADYYPGGMMMPGRNTEHDWSRMGSQFQQKDDEVYGKGNTYAFKYRMEDARINRFFSADPLHFKYAHNSDYAFSENRLTDGVDFEGLEYSPSSQKLMRDGTAVMQIPNPELTNPANMRIEPNLPQATIKQNWSGTIYGSESNYLYHQKLTEQTAALIPFASIAIQKARGEEVTKKDLAIEAAITFIPIGKIAKGLKGVGGELVEQVAKKVDNIAGHLTEKDISGAIRDIAGNPVVINGKTYDHLDEVTSAIKGLENQIGKLNKAIDGGKLTGEALGAAKSLRSNVQTQKDAIQGVLDRATKKATAQ